MTLADYTAYYQAARARSFWAWLVRMPPFDRFWIWRERRLPRAFVVERAP